MTGAERAERFTRFLEQTRADGLVLRPEEHVVDLDEVDDDEEER